MSPAVRAAVWAFSAFAVVNIPLSAAVALAIDPLCARAARLGPLTRARLLLALRCLPAAVSFGVAAFVVMPSYLVFEPNSEIERTSLIGLASASTGAALCAAGLWRGIRAIVQLRRITARWLEHAVPFPRLVAPLPAFIADGRVPGMTLLGLRHPRILVSRALADALTPEELNTAFEHEFAHRRAWDNPKRLAIAVLPDALPLFAGARRLERQWALAAEQSADAVAAWDTKARLALASALVKGARLPAGDRAVLASPLIDAEMLALRVERLLKLPELDALAAESVYRGWLIAAVAVAVLAAGSFADAAPFRAIHHVSEEFFEALP